MTKKKPKKKKTKQNKLSHQLIENKIWKVDIF